jgi:hypothetical protein
MKTMIEVDDLLMIKARRVATARRQTLRELVEQGLRHVLEHKRTTASRSTKGLRWVAVAGDLPAGIDLADREQMSRRFGRRA